MAIKMNNLQQYELIHLSDGTKFKGPFGASHNGAPEQIIISLFPEQKSLDELYEIFDNSNILDTITITSKDEHDLMHTFQHYKILEDFKVEREGAYTEGYTEQGEYYKYTSPVVTIILRRPNANDKLPQMEATMEYIAIMADIDIDEE